MPAHADLVAFSGVELLLQPVLGLFKEAALPLELREPRELARVLVVDRRGAQLGDRLVLRGANEDSLFSSEKLGKAAFIMVPFVWGVVDWAHPPWYDVVLDAFRG